MAIQMSSGAFRIILYGLCTSSFAMGPDTTLYNRRLSKILSSIVSVFSASYIRNWDMGDLKMTPSFDGRVVLYPNLEVLKDYFRWRQVDCHINNMYNYAFWKLVDKRLLNEREDTESQRKIVKCEIQNRLKDTDSAAKNEILFSECGINYNNLPELHKKGTVIIRQKIDSIQPNRMLEFDSYRSFRVANIDIIRQAFWETFL